MQHNNTPIDGRSERTRRSKDRIVEALLNLYSDGILVPTAQEVADRSGLGIRTVFRHFNEMESLFIAGDNFLHKKFADKTIEIPTPRKIAMFKGIRSAEKNVTSKTTASDRVARSAMRMCPR